ncbi:MAG: type II secretion system secretin GspD [Syntrophobacterales bacterium]|nr:type II secretion system secretin GspD [Syntrophobacterales bacterium]
MSKAGTKKWAVMFLSLTLLLGGGCSSMGKKQEISPLIPQSLRDAISQERPSLPQAPSLPPKDQEAIPDRNQQGATSGESKKKEALNFPEQKPKARYGVVTPKEVSSRPSPTLSKEKQHIVLNFDKADVAEITQQLFAQYLGLNYVLDPTLKMPMSFYLEGTYSKEELLRFMAEIYWAHGIDVVDRNGIYHIQPFNRTTGARARLLKPEDISFGSGPQPGLCIYRLQYISADKVQNVIRSFLTPNRPLIAEPVTNTIIFVDAMDNVKTIVEILRSMDTNILKDMGVEVIQLQHLSPKEITEAFDKVVQKINPTYREMISRNLVVLPLERVSSIMIVSSDPHVMKTAKEWIKSLDVEGRDSGEQFYVYFVKNGLAKNIVGILKELFTGKKEAPQHLPQHVVSAEQRRPEEKQEAEKQAQATATTTTTTAASTLSSIGVKLTGEVSIISDETNNAIIIKANPTDYARIKRVIEEIDILPRAVLIEMLIAEITLNDETQYGVEWFLKNKAMKIGGKEGIYSLVQDYGVQFNRNFDLGKATSQGISFFWGTLRGDIASLVNLLSSLTHFNVLSAPTILATDNQKASITVGGKTPVISQQVIDTTSTNLTNTVQYVDTGIILNVTPHINAGGIVRMEVEQTIRDAIKNTVSGIDSPAFTERKITTNLLAKDGTTVVIGGIIQEKSNISRSGIPFLSRIPYIGSAFSSTDKSKERTELLIAITPRVIDHVGNDASAEFLQKLRLLKAVMSESTAPTPPPPPPQLQPQESQKNP